MSKQCTLTGIVTVAAGGMGLVDENGVPGNYPTKTDAQLAAKSTEPGPWSAYLSYATPGVQELTSMANGTRAPLFAELRWSPDGGARATVLRAPIPAVGVCLSAPMACEVWVGRYIPTLSSIAMLCNLAPGRPSAHFAGTGPGLTPTDLQLIPEFSARVLASSSSPANISWHDVNGTLLYTVAVAAVTAVDPRARFVSFDDASGAVAFEVIH